jgi:hypothetical protein
LQGYQWLGKVSNALSLCAVFRFPDKTSDIPGSVLFRLSSGCPQQEQYTMAKSAKNTNLQKAKKEKNDEFYTQLSDIENELKHYTQHFAGKTVYCNCDDPKASGFVRYFFINFSRLGLKRLIATCYKNPTSDLFSTHTAMQSFWLDYTGEDRTNDEKPDFRKMRTKKFNGDGDFRSDECIALLKQADIVCTNPPFSLFREYVAQLMEYGKSFLIIGNMNALCYKEIFPLIKDNKLWIGINNGAKHYLVPDSYQGNTIIDNSGNRVKQMGNTYWFTNLDHSHRHNRIDCYKKYTAKEYPHYDNYDAINVDKTAEIPLDYNGVMGVPISFLDKYNPEQFDIEGTGEDNGRGLSFGLWKGGDLHCVVHNERKYKRIFIRHRR